MQVTVIGQTWYNADAARIVMSDFTSTSIGGEALVEAAGRACYQSWSKPNPATADNAGYIAHILEAGHLSVLEHGTATMYITGVSRSLTHELVRHRHFSFSQMSQRYVDESDFAPVIPPALRPHLSEIADEISDYISRSGTLYTRLVSLLAQRGATRKQAREAARAVLPQMAETRIVVTGNYRTWRHFIALRATEHADAEIRELALECLARLRSVAFNVFSDFELVDLGGGVVVARSEYE